MTKGVIWICGGVGGGGCMWVWCGWWVWVWMRGGRIRGKVSTEFAVGDSRGVLAPISG